MSNPEPGSVAAALANAGPQSFKAWLTERNLSEIIEQAPKELRRALPKAVRLLALRESLPAKIEAAMKKLVDLVAKKAEADNAEATVEKSIRFLESLKKSLFDFESAAVPAGFVPPDTTNGPSTDNVPDSAAALSEDIF